MSRVIRLLKLNARFRMPRRDNAPCAHVREAQAGGFFANLAGVRGLLGGRGIAHRFSGDLQK